MDHLQQTVFCKHDYENDDHTIKYSDVYDAENMLHESKVCKYCKNRVFKCYSCKNFTYDKLSSTCKYCY